MKIQLSDHFTYNKLIRFTLPSIVMIIFTSIYTMVDGFFISNYVGKTAFASINLIFPYIQILGGMGTMLGVGGSALVAMTLGTGDTNRAQKYFTMMTYLMAIVGVVCTFLGFIFLKPMAHIFGATENMMEDCLVYGGTCLVFNTVWLMQYGFQSYLVVAEKPKFGLMVTVLAGLTNMILDFLFMAVFHLGVFGAAMATGLSQCVGALVPLFWFISKKNTTHLRFEKTKIELAPVLRACGNGLSEMLSSVSGSITGILYNLQLMKYAGEDGVAAYGVVMYAAFIFMGVFMGYSSGSSPIMGYHYGAQNHKEMKNVMKKSMILLGCSAVVLTCGAFASASTLAKIFVGYDAALWELTTHAFIICSIPFLFMWFNVYASSFFTALNDGAVSAAISFMRALVLPVTSIIVMPMILGLDGVWFSFTSSELLGIVVSLVFLLGKRKKYGY